MTSIINNNFWKDQSNHIIGKLGEAFKNDYNKQEDLKQKHSWLRNPSPLGDAPFNNWQVFGQVNAQAFIQDTPLEGFSQDEALNHFASFLGFISKLNKRPEWKFIEPFQKEIEKFQKQLNRCEEIAKGDKLSLSKLEDHKETIFQNIRTHPGFVSKDAEWKKLAELLLPKILKELISEKPSKLNLDDFKNYDQQTILKCSEDLTPLLLEATKPFIEKEKQSQFDKIVKEFSQQPGWFPGGWISNTGENHAVMYWIDPKGRFTIVNSGAGLEKFHPPYKHTSIDPLTNKCKEEVKHQLFVSSSNVNKDKIKDPDFFRALLAFSDMKRIDLELEATHVYSGLLGFLEGSFETGSDPYANPELYKKGQESGTCAFQSIKAAFFYHLCDAQTGTPKNTEAATDCYKLLKFFWESYLLAEQFKSCVLPLPLATVNLLTMSMSNLAREAEKLKVKGLISEESLFELNITLLDIDDKLKMSSATPQAPEDPFQYEIRDVKGSDIVVEIDQNKKSATNQKVAAPNSLSVDELLSNLAIKYNSLSFSIDNLIEFANELKLLTLELLNLKDTKNVSDCQFALNILRQWIAKIPMPKKNEKDVWDSIDSIDILDTMHTLDSLIYSLQELTNLIIKEEKHSPETVVMAYGIYAVMDKLARRLPDNKTYLAGFTSNYFDILLELQSPNFILTHPELQKTLHGLMLYFHGSFNVETANIESMDLEVEKHARYLFSFNGKWDSRNSGSGFNQVLSRRTRNANETFLYIQKFIEKSDPNDLVKLGIEPGMSLVKKITIVLKNIDKDILPAGVSLLVKCQKNCLGLIHAQSYMNEGWTNPDIHVSEKNKFPEEYDVTLYISYSSKGNYLYNQISDASLSNIITYKNTQNQIVLTNDRYKELDIDLTHELKMISMDPYDEMNRAIDFGRRHLFAFEKTEIQEMFRAHLLRPERIISQLKDNPEAAQNAAEFFKEALKYYKEQQNTKVVQYLCVLGASIQSFVIKAGCNANFPNFRQVLIEIYEPFCKHYSAKNKLFKALICLYYSKTFEDAENQEHFAEDIFGAALMSRLLLKDKNSIMTALDGLSSIEALNYITKQSKDLKDVPYNKRYKIATLCDQAHMAATPQEVRKLFEEALNIIIKLKENEENSKNPQYLIEALVKEHLTLLQNKMKNSLDDVPANLLQKLLGVINVTSENGQWRGNYPTFENDLYEIDLQNLVISEKSKGTYDSLPEAIATNAYFKKLFKGILKSCSKDLNNSNRYTLNKGEADELIAEIHVVKGAAKPDVKYFRIIDGKEYQYLMPNYIKSLKESISTSLYPSDYACWFSDNPTPHIFVQDGTKKTLYQINLIFDAAQYKVEKTVRLSDNLEYIPFYKLPESWKELQNIEGDDREIICWGKDGKLEEITLSRLGLHFNVEKNKGVFHTYSKEYPGYYLVSSTEQNTLVLAKPSGELKILKAKVQLAVESIQNDDGALVNNLQGKLKEAPIWLAYTEDMSSFNLEGTLYRFYELLCLGKYQEAKTLLPKTYSFTLYTKEEEEILWWISELLKESKNSTVLALGISLLLKVKDNYLVNQHHTNKLKSNDQKSFLTFLEDPKQLIAIFKKYNRTNAPLHQLSDGDEKSAEYRFLKHIDDTYVSKIAEKEKFATSNAAKNQLKQFNYEYALFRIKYESRLNYLKTGRATLGYESITPITTKNKENDNTLSYYLLTLFRHGNSSIKFKVNEPLIIKEKQLKDNFVGYYRIATMGSKKERRTLKHILELNPCSEDPELRRYRNILKSVCSQPWLYPKIKKNIPLEPRIELKIQIILKFAAIAEAFSSETSLKPRFPVISHIKGLFASSHKRKIKVKASPQPLTWTRDSLKKLDEAFENYFTEKCTQYITQTEESKEKGDAVVQPKLSETHDKPAIAKTLQKMNQELDEYRTVMPKKITYHHDGDINALKDELSACNITLAQELKTEKQMLLWQVNDVTHKEGQDLKHLKQLGHLQKLSWNDLQKLVLSGDLHEFEKRTYLKQEECERLLIGVAGYLLKEMRLNQMVSAIKAIENYESEMKNNEKNPNYLQLLLQDISDTLCMKHTLAFDFESRDKLWFEFKNQYFLRKEQLEKMNDILKLNREKRELLVECPTGYGKTKTVIPNVNYQLQQQGHHVTNLYPSTLELINATDVRNQMADSFCEEAMRLSFNRSSKITPEMLEFIYDELRSGKLNNMRPESAQALELHFLTSLQKQINARYDERDDVCIAGFMKILRFFRLPHERVLTDEEHRNFDPFEKLIYTLGKSERIPEEQIDLYEILFKFLMSPKYHDRLKIRDNLQAFTSKETIKTIVHELADDLLNPSKEFAKTPLFTVEDIQKYKEFVLTRSEDATIPEWVLKHPQKQHICLVKGLLSLIFKSSLKGFVDENFGWSIQHFDTKEFAISFLGSNTPKETEMSPSQFKNPHETLFKTYFTFFNKGLTFNQVKRFYMREKGQAAAEISLGIAPSDTQANAFFRQLVGPDLLPKKFVHQLNDEDLALIHEAITKNDTAIYHYIRHFVAPQIKVYPKTFTSTVQNLRSQFFSDISFSATPLETETHGPETHFVPMRNVRGKVTHMLLTKGANNIDIFKSEKPADTFAEALDKTTHNRLIRSFVDTGGQFRSLTNLQMAQEIRNKTIADKRDDILGILFFDDKDEKYKLLVVKDGTIVLPEEHKLDPRNRMAIYDQPRTFATDLKLALDNVALLMIGKETTFAKAAQGLGRNRQGDKKQGFKIGIPPSVAEDVFKKGKEDITTLVEYLVAKQVKEDAEKNFQGQLLQMDNEIRNAIICKILGLPVGKEPSMDLLNKEPSVLKAEHYFKLFEKELTTYDSSDPFVLYAAMTRKKETIGCLEAYQADCVERVKKIKGFTEQEKLAILDRLKPFNKGKWQKMNLPTKVMPAQNGIGLQCEVLQEVEVETQVQQQVKTQDKTDSRSPWFWPDKMDLFKAGWEKPQNRFSFYVKLSLKIQNIGKSITQAIKKVGGKIWGNRVVKVIAVGLIIIGYVFLLSQPIGLAILTTAIVLTIIRNTKWYKNKKLNLEKRFRKIPPVYRTSEVLKLHLPTKKLRKASEFYNNNLLVSNNFWTQKPQWGEDIQVPFDENEEKPLQNVLVIQDVIDGNKQLQVMIVDMNDTIYFRRRLQEDNKLEQIGKRTRKIAVYDLHEGILAQGKNQFDAKELENNAEFKMLCMKAKVLSGASLNDEEQKLYNQEAAKVDTEIMERIQNELILPLHPIQLLLKKRKKPIVNVAA